MNTPLILAAPYSARSQELADALATAGYQVETMESGYTGHTTFSGEVDAQEKLIIAFPAEIKGEAAIKEQVLSKTFEIVQTFVQKRMRKKSGSVIFLMSAPANGMVYTDEKTNNDNSWFYIAQGGLTGFAKTIVKEYGKKGLNANAIYVDWTKVDLDSLAKSLTAQSSDIAGQVYAADQGVCL